jgi:hypothetical protein
MSGAIPKLPRYASMAWRSVKSQKQLYLSLSLITLITFAEDYKLCSSALYNFVQLLLNILLSNTLYLFSSFMITDQVSHPYTKTNRYSSLANCINEVTILNMSHHYH